MITYVKEISFYDYLLGSKMPLPPLGTYYVRHSLTRDSIIIGAHLEERTVGIAVIEFIPKPKLAYVFVEENFRQQGIGTQLVKAALTHAGEKSIAEVETCVIMQNEYGEVIDHILRKIGFEMIETATIIRGANDERCRRIWDVFMREKGKRICSKFIGRGYKTLPFSKASTVTFDRLKASIGREFASTLNPFSYVSNQNDRIVPEYSYITLKNDDPVAFVIVTTVDDKNLVFQQLSTALGHQGNGIFLLPFAAFAERFLGGTYGKVSAVIFDKNVKMQRLMHSFIGSLAESIKTQNFYQYK